MANAAILWRNLADAGTISATSSVASMPAARLREPRTRIRWQSLSGSASLVLDHGSSVTWDTAAVPGCIASTCRLRASDSDPTGALGDLHDSGVEAVDSDFGMPVFALDASITARYARFDFTHASLAYVAAGRLVTGLRTVYAYNFDYGWAEGVVDPSERSVTRGGQIYISEREAFRWMEVNFGWMTEAQARGVVAQIDRENGLRKDVLFMRDPDSDNLARDSVWGLLASLAGTINPFIDLYSKTYRIEERL